MCESDLFARPGEGGWRSRKDVDGKGMSAYEVSEPGAPPASPVPTASLPTLQNMGVHTLQQGESWHLNKETDIHQPCHL